MTYIFALRSVTDERLLPQLEAVFERCPELPAREQLPKAWRAVERVEPAPPRVTDSGIRRRRLRYRTLGVMLLLLGALLVVPEFLSAREISSSLVVGALALAWGSFVLIDRDRRTRKREKPETPAQRLLHELGGLGRAGAHAIFTGDALSVETPDGERVELGYAVFEMILETRDFLLLLDASRAVILQKNELSWGEWADFREFLAEKADIQIVPHGK